jgi:2-oxoglutarate dehydrogenase E2 component (dihydrolipoamide succinyltransferase)
MAGDMPPAPSAAKMMADKGVSAEQVSGSGKRGQVLKGDVIDALSSGCAGDTGRNAEGGAGSVIRNRCGAKNACA